MDVPVEPQFKLDPLLEPGSELKEPETQLHYQFLPRNPSFELTKLESVGGKRLETGHQVFDVFVSVSPLFQEVLSSSGVSSGAAVYLPVPSCCTRRDTPGRPIWSRRSFRRDGVPSWDWFGLMRPRCVSVGTNWYADSVGPGRYRMSVTSHLYQLPPSTFLCPLLVLEDFSI